MEIIDYLLGLGLNVDELSNDKITPLMDAVGLRRTYAILALLRQGAQTDIEFYPGRSILSCIQELLLTEPKNPTEAEHFRQIQELLPPKPPELTPSSSVTSSKK